MSLTISNLVSVSQSPNETQSRPMSIDLPLVVDLRDMP